MSEETGDYDIHSDAFKNSVKTSKRTMSEQTPEEFLKKVSPDDKYGIRADLLGLKCYRPLLHLMDRYGRQRAGTANKEKDDYIHKANAKILALYKEKEELIKDVYAYSVRSSEWIELLRKEVREFASPSNAATQVIKEMLEFQSFSRKLLSNHKQTKD